MNGADLTIDALPEGLTARVPTATDAHDVAALLAARDRHRGKEQRDG